MTTKLELSENAKLALQIVNKLYDAKEGHPDPKTHMRVFKLSQKQQQETA